MPFHPFYHVIPPLFGYKAPSTAGLNADEPLLEVGGSPEESDITLLKEEDFFPKKLTLRAIFRPIPRGPSQTQVTLITQGEALKTGRLYNDPQTHVEPSTLIPHARYQDIQLLYQGIGSYQLGLENLALQGLETESFRIALEAENILYTKPFAVETRPVIFERVTQIGDGRVFTNPPGRFDVRVLRPYGGYYQPGLPAEQCQQVYYDLSEKEESTAVLLTLESPPNAVFVPSLPSEQVLSLGAALCAGYAQLTLLVDEQKRIYQSMSYQHPGNNTQLIDVVFIPQR